MELNLDKALKMSLIIRQRDNYDVTFFVKKNDIDYDWDNVTNIILEIKKTKKDAQPVLTITLQDGGIEIQTGIMIWHLNPSKTDLEAGLYKSLELLIVYNNNKPKLWIDGTCEVLARSINV